MILVYLASAIDDIAWMRLYYTRTFPEGARRAAAHIRAVEKAISANPQIGRPTEFARVCELVVPRTPFSVIYRVMLARIEILRVWDNRAERSAAGFELF